MTVVSCTGFGDAATVRAHGLNQSEATARTLEKEEVAQVQECDAQTLQGAPDMVKFAKLSEATLLHNLRVRYSRNDIYTRAGSILISVNPFKQLSIYTPERMAQCKVGAGCVPRRAHTSRASSPSPYPQSDCSHERRGPGRTPRCETRAPPTRTVQPPCRTRTPRRCRTSSRTCTRSPRLPSEAC